MVSSTRVQPNRSAVGQIFESKRVRGEDVRDGRRKEERRKGESARGRDNLVKREREDVTRIRFDYLARVATILEMRLYIIYLYICIYM